MPVDSHAHLQMKAFSDDCSDVISRALKAGIEFIVVPGSDIPFLEEGAGDARPGQAYHSCSGNSSP